MRSARQDNMLVSERTFTSRADVIRLLLKTPPEIVHNSCLTCIHDFPPISLKSATDIHVLPVHKKGLVSEKKALTPFLLGGSPRK